MCETIAGMKRLRPFLYTIGTPIAGLAALGFTAAVGAAGALVMLPYLSPGAVDEDGQPQNVVGKLAFWAAGWVAGMVGGYVATWVASRAKQAGLQHAMVVGMISGVFSVLSNSESPPPSWILLGRTFVVFFLSAVLGGWIRLLQARRAGAAFPNQHDHPTEV